MYSRMTFNGIKFKKNIVIAFGMSCIYLGDAYGASCLDLKRLFTGKIQPLHQQISYEDFKSMLPYHRFDLKISSDELLFERFSEVYSDPTRYNLLNGIPGKLNGISDLNSVKLRAFWLDEYSLLKLDSRGSLLDTHPYFTVHPALNKFIQKIYREESLFGSVPDDIMKQVLREDNDLYPLASGWVVLSQNNTIIATVRVHFADYKRYLSRTIPFSPKHWTLPMENIKAGNGEYFTTPEHQKIIDTSVAIFPEMNKAISEAREASIDTDPIFDKYSKYFRELHENYQVGEIGETLIKSHWILIPI